ncbi:Uncharacterised protein [Candidatus Norongarragalina meridionalis]|nr:Uncharacterised protein [Candidatus Norongarragalina meridionalis]
MSAFETKRQAAHMAFGALLVGIGVLFGENALVAFLFACLVGGLALLNWHRLGGRNKLVNGILDSFERRFIEFPGKGALMYVVGALFLVTFSQNLQFALAMICALAFGDGFATIIGVRGMHPLAWNKSKSAEGLAAFIVASVASASLFVPFNTALFFSVILAVVEAIDFPVDDNLLIPAVAVLLKLGVGVPA